MFVKFYASAIPIPSAVHRGENLPFSDTPSFFCELREFLQGTRDTPFTTRVDCSQVRPRVVTRRRRGRERERRKNIGKKYIYVFNCGTPGARNFLLEPPRNVASRDAVRDGILF